MPKQGKLIDLLRETSRAEGIRCDDWIFLQSEELRPDSPALLIADEFDTIEDLESIAAKAGFPREGVQASDVQGIFEGVARHTRQPTDEQIVRAFDYYLRFDAFLPTLDAPDPPPSSEVLLAYDREFFESLAEEDESRPCRREGCNRGSV